jgi:hypothetical protein
MIQVEEVAKAAISRMEMKPQKKTGGDVSAEHLPPPPNWLGPPH